MSTMSTGSVLLTLRNSHGSDSPYRISSPKKAIIYNNMNYGPTFDVDLLLIGKNGTSSLGKLTMHQDTYETWDTRTRIWREVLSLFCPNLKFIILVYVLHFFLNLNYDYWINHKNGNFLNCDWFKKNSYFPLICLPSYRTVCYWTIQYC